MLNSVSCIAASEIDARNLTLQLKAAGFPEDEISVLFPDSARTSKFAHVQHTKAPEGAAIGAGTGGLLGGAVGWLVGIGTIAIPGLGPFIAAGPILAALSGAAAGAAVGGLAGTLVGLGVPEIEAKAYEQELKEGHILIAVCCRDEGDVARAERVFREGKGRQISSPRSIVTDA
jgi:hypothetical protein